MNSQATRADAIVTVTLPCGSPYHVCASRIGTWLVATVAERLRLHELHAELNAEGRRSAGKKSSRRSIE